MNPTNEVEQVWPVKLEDKPAFPMKLTEFIKLYLHTTLPLLFRQKYAITSDFSPYLWNWFVGNTTFSYSVRW